MIIVKNVKKDGKPEMEWEVYIGRYNAHYGLEPSVLASQFPLSEYTREESIEKYREWLRAELADDNRVVIGEMNRLYLKWQAWGKLSLFCWCAPLACHGDVIRQTLLDAKARTLDV